MHDAESVCRTFWQSSFPTITLESPTVRYCKFKAPIFRVSYCSGQDSRPAVGETLDPL